MNYQQYIKGEFIMDEIQENESKRRIQEHVEKIQASAKEMGEVQILDYVNFPPHYRQGNFETIDVIEDWKLGFHLGNALKYICRSAHKGSEIQDLHKACWYINRHIDQLEKELEE